MNQAEASKLVRSLFESWHSSVVRYAYRVSGSLQLAEDVVQEAFMALYRELRQGKEIENPKGWVLCVVGREIGKYERSRRRRGERVELLDVLDTVPDRDAEDHPPEAEDELTELFSVLTRREEEVILLRMQALKYKEIASQLGISSNSVKTLLARGLRKLRMAAKAKSTGGRISPYESDGVPKTLQ